MNKSGNVVLITGGASGIGLALAERFLKGGNEVLICGRRADKLAEAQQAHPELRTFVGDMADEADRLRLFAWAVKKEGRGVNVLVNNAGIQQRIDLTAASGDWANYRQEIAINLEAPVHLAMLFVPHLRRQKKPAIINVTSGLAFMPPAWVPVYGSTKAALHSFTVSLRLQLEDSGIEVIEVIPPAINTDLGGVGLHTFGEPVDAFADAVFQGLARGDSEIGYGSSLRSMSAGRAELTELAKAAWQRLKKH